jgi:large subunit ribosomal protein L31
MKKDIHPKYYPKATITCSCGNSFEVGATVEQLRIDICPNCHPLYTGKTKLVDTAGRVDRFKERLQKAQAKKGLTG